MQRKRNKTVSQEHWNTKRAVCLIAALFTILAVVISICFLIVHQSNHIINEETKRNLAEVSEQSSDKINQRIQFNLAMLENASDNLALLENSPELKAEYFLNFMDKVPFEWVEVVDCDGLLSDGKGVIDLSDDSTFQAALKGKTGVSRHLEVGFDGRKGNLYFAPYRKNGVIEGVVVGWVPPAVLQKLLSTDIFGGEGFNHIINANGDFVVHSDNKNSVIEEENFFAAMEAGGEFYDGASQASMMADMVNEKSGHLHFTIHENVEEAMEYTPLDGDGWFLLTIVPMKVYGERINDLTQLSVSLSLIMVALFLLLIGAILYISRKNYLGLQKLAYEDPVTGGYTPQRFELEFRDRLQVFAPFALVSLDIRRFKLINDRFGSEKGDAVLKYVHDRIKKCLHADEFVSRLASDSFNLILNTVDKAEVEVRLKKIAAEINAFNFEVDAPYYLTIDCGVFLVTQPEADVGIVAMRDRANTARKSNKHWDGDDRYTCMFYNDGDRLKMLLQQEMENAEEHALKNREFVVYLQPKVELKTGKIAGAEALTRWNSPEKGLIFPGDYIPLFERNGFIRKLDLYVFEETCRLLCKWINDGKVPVSISVNLSRSYLRVPHFMDDYKEIQKQYAVPPELIEFELTETVVFENLQMLKQVIDEIHQCGFKCSMDDFGSGYSSLNVLKEVPVDVLKLDRGFFLEENDKRGNDIVRTILQLAKKLRIMTVSEGIESQTQVEFLRGAGCDLVQGYVFSKPVPIQEFEQKLYK